MVGTGHMPISRMRQPLDNKPATTACLTISPEVRGSRPMTIVRAPIYVPNACAKRVNREGVNDSPITPRTPEMLILRVGIGRMKYEVRRPVAAFTPKLLSKRRQVVCLQSLTYSIGRAPNPAGGVPSSHLRPQQ